MGRKQLAEEHHTKTRGQAALGGERLANVAGDNNDLRALFVCCSVAELRYRFQLTSRRCGLLGQWGKLAVPPDWQTEMNMMTQRLATALLHVNG